MTLQSPQPLFEEIFALAQHAMPELVNPAINPQIAAKMPEFTASLERTFSPGHPRDCLHAALWLLADNLNESHIVCQNIPTHHGSAWHALLHRREGDFSNSKYWWRRCPDLPWHNLTGQIHAALAPLNPPAALASWANKHAYDPAGFVDIVASHVRQPSPCLTSALVIIQRLEWLALFADSWQSAQRP